MFTASVLGDVVTMTLNMIVLHVVYMFAKMYVQESLFVYRDFTPRRTTGVKSTSGALASRAICHGTNHGPPLRVGGWGAPFVATLEQNQYKLD